MTKVDRAWFVKGATLIAIERDFSKSAAGVDREVRWTVLGTRNMANGTLRVKMQHEHKWGFTLVVPPGDEVKARVRPVGPSPSGSARQEATMTNKAAPADLSEMRSFFDEMVAESTDPDVRATRELLREYFCNPKFKPWMTQFIWEQTKAL